MNRSYRGSILAALLLSGAGARFLALSNFNLMVLFFVVAMVYGLGRLGRFGRLSRLRV
jgi:hypothetical protein